MSGSFNRTALIVFCSFALMAPGHGLLGTVLGIRAATEGFPLAAIGLMGSGFYAGFIAGSVLAPRLIMRTGHIRSFCIYAFLAGLIVLGFALQSSPAGWIVLRTLYGVCASGIYVVVEGWLNAVSTNKNRGKILGFYMILNYLGLATGQAVLFLAGSPGLILFVLASLLLFLSPSPLLGLRPDQPEAHKEKHFSFRRLFQASPLAAMGCFGVGLILGSYWGLGAVFITKLGLPAQDVALFICSVLLGGFLFQWPLGALSDRYPRRIVVGFVCLAGCLTSLTLALLVTGGIGEFSPLFFVGSVLFGGMNYTLYSLMLSLMNDALEPAEVTRASGSMLALHSVGAILGPITAAAVMSVLGPAGLMYFEFAAAAAIAALVFLCPFQRPITSRV